MAEARRPRFPTTWSDWVSGDWLAPATDIVNRMVGVATELAPLATPQAFIGQLITQIEQRLAGRDLTLQTSKGEVRLVLDALRADPTSAGLAVGQLGDVELQARDVRWEDHAVDRLEMRFRNVHVRPGSDPVLVTAPIDVTVRAGQATVDDLVGPRVAKLTVEVIEDNVALVGLAGKERLGKVEVVPRIEGGKVRAVATGLRVAGRRIGLPWGGVATVAIDIPPLPEGFQVRSAELHGGQVVVHGMIDELRYPLVAAQLQATDRLVRAGASAFDLRPQ
jgi:hypothetical protein